MDAVQVAQAKFLLALATGSRSAAEDKFNQLFPTPKRDPKPRSLAVIYPKEAAAYRAAKARCQNPNHPEWEHYGGRGIRMRFASFEEFLDAVGPCPSPELTLDRRNNHLDYEFGNVRSTDWTTQNNNRRPRRYRFAPKVEELSPEAVAA